jgi:HSP20 family protein
MLAKKSPMAAVHHDPLAFVRRMSSELDRMFDEWPFFRLHSPGAGATDHPSWSPRIDVFEKDNRLVTRVDLPGVKREDVSVEVTDGHLALSGTRKEETEEKKGNYYRTEREYGSFYRAVPLPDGIKADDVKATFANGVLEISVPLPLQTESRARKIAIDAPTASE